MLGEKGKEKCEWGCAIYRKAKASHATPGGQQVIPKTGKEKKEHCGRVRSW